MATLQNLNISYDQFLDRTALIVGESGTGKSTVIVDMMHTLKPHVDQIIVISPTDRQNRTYSQGTVPLPCIHYTMTPELLNDIWDRQNALVSVYTKANDVKVLEGLFNRIPNDNGGKRKALLIIKNIHDRLHDTRTSLQNQGTDEETINTKVADMKAKTEKLVQMIWRNYINMHSSWLSKQRLTKEEQYTLKYLNLNPKLVLIFDDCTDLLKKYKSHPVIQKLFYQGRWAHITVFIACHTDKALDPELKKNAYMTIFTAQPSATAYFERKSNDLDREAKARALEAMKCAFTPLAKHQKLVWVRDERMFRRYTATRHDNFRFGSQAVWEYCNRIKADASSVSADNKFIGSFSV